MTSAHANDGWVGVYADAAGTTACTTVPAFTGTTLYVIAKTAGATANGISGAEFRIEVSNPTGWFFSYYPPTGSTPIGNILDTDPGNQSDGSGLNIVFPTCQQPVDNTIFLGTISLFNAGGSPTSLSVKRHSNPTNPGYLCPLFTLCNDPSFSQVCMSTSTDAACQLAGSKALPWSVGDGAVFSATLNEVGHVSGDPDPDALAIAPPVLNVPVLLSHIEEPDIIGDGTPGGTPSVAKVQDDWSIEWTFDSSDSLAPWMRADNRIQSNGIHHWKVDSLYTHDADVVSHNVPFHGCTADLMEHNVPCWVFSDGYGNGWDTAICLMYRGAANIDFDYMLDSIGNTYGEGDFLTVEADSACASGNLVSAAEGANENGKPPSAFRKVVTDTDPSAGGLPTHKYGRLFGHFHGALPNYGTGDHCVFIRFTSDESVSPEDRFLRSTGTAWKGTALVVDNIVTTGGFPIQEGFTGGAINNPVQVGFVNTARSKPFGLWARVFNHITDNDKCTENTNRALLFTNPSFIAVDPTGDFGPGHAIIANWLDNVVVSPWVAVPPNQGTTLSFLELPGNLFTQSSIVRAISFRGKDASGCISSWSNEAATSDKQHGIGSWEELNTYSWVTRVSDVSSLVNPLWPYVQVRFRVSDWQYIGGGPPPSPRRVGPGPFIDKVRLGRFSEPGPVISEGGDSRTQAQDAFPTGGVRISDTSPFQMAMDLRGTRSSAITPGDSIVVTVRDIRNAGGIQSVMWYGTIVAGPHMGRAPAPYSVGANGFFMVHADSARSIAGAAVRDLWSVDLDKAPYGPYFRGGDVVRYFWLAKDNGQAISSDPVGITIDPDQLTSVRDAESRTGGLLEVNFLPTITWAPSYLTHLATDGYLEPTDTERTLSTQANCILYVNKVNPRRCSGQLNLTSFMFTLGQLGYAKHDTLLYDVYDVQGSGNVANDLASRSSVDQCDGYSLIVHDTGRSRSGTMPDAIDLTTNKVNQAWFYHEWINDGTLAIPHSLWVIGENLVEEKYPGGPGSPPDHIHAYDLLWGDMGVVYDHPNVLAWSTTGPSAGDPTPADPSVVEVAHCATAGSGLTFKLEGGCPTLRDYDVIHRRLLPQVTLDYKWASNAAYGPIVFASPRADVTTIMMTFGWADIRNASGGSQVAAEILATTLLACTPLPSSECRRSPNATDLEESAPPPLVTGLFQNSPNPFNPSTTIKFDLASKEQVELKVYNVAGRLVRMLITGKMARGHHAVQWDGRDDGRRGVSSGVYFYRFEAGGFLATRKLVILK